MCFFLKCLTFDGSEEKCRNLPSFGTSFGSPEGLRILLEPR